MLVVGGGIGGLCTAIALARARIDVRVIERAPSLREVGAGITLWSNALRVLRELDLESAVLSRGERLESGSLRDWRGRTLVQTPIARVSSRLGAECVALARADLQSVLVAALPTGVLALDSACATLVERKDAVEVVLASGETLEASLVIGADGIHSAVRAALHPKARATRYAGYTCWRAIADAPLPAIVRAQAWESWGPGQRFGLAPLGCDRVYWFASKNAPPGERDDDPRSALLAHFRGWHAPIEELVAATPRARILQNDIVDRAPMRRWGRGRTTLLGDAAHASTPNLGQGACLAIEDAWVLARALATHGVGERALRAYEAAREARTRAITERSRRLGWIGQRPTRLACSVRDALMRALPANVHERMYTSSVAFDPRA